MAEPLRAKRDLIAELLGISSFQIIVMFRRGLFYSFLAVYLRHFLKMSATETTLFATAPMVVNVVFQMFVWGRISDRFQLRRTLIIVGEVLAAAGTVAAWYAHRIPDDPRAAGYVIIAALSVIEIFWSMSNVAWSALISDLYRKEDRAGVQGQLASIGAIGRIIGVWVGGILYDGLGQHYEGWGFHEGTLFFVAAAAMLISTVPMLNVHEGGVAAGGGTDGAGEAASTEEPPAGSARLFIIFLVAMVFTNFGRNSITVIRAPYLALDAGFDLSSTQIGYVMNTQSIAMVIFGVFAGRIARRFGTNRTLMAGTCAAIASLAVYAFAETIGLIYAASVLAGVGDVIIRASAYAYAAALIPSAKRGRLFGVFNATMFLSWGMAGTFIAGPIIDVLIAREHGEIFAYRMSFIAAAALTVVGLGIQVYLAGRGPSADRPSAG